MAQIRINKYLSMCGVTSRRGAEVLIAQGKVTINNVTVEKLGVMVDDATDVVRVDGTEAVPVTEKIYVVLNKSRNVMTTLHDPFGRKTVVHSLKGLKHRVYPVGRLDFDTTGVLVLTNDGDLAFKLAHPRFEVEKIYEARVLGRFTIEDKARIEGGIELDDGAIGRAKVEILGHHRHESRIRLILTEGRKREVKQLCKKVGRPVRALNRVEFAGITTRGLKTGSWRNLTAAEVAAMKKLVGL